MTTNPLPFLAASIYTSYKQDPVFRQNVDKKPGCRYANMVADSNLARDHDPDSKEQKRLVELIKYLFN